MDFWNEIKNQGIQSAQELMQKLNDVLYLQSEEGESLVKALTNSFDEHVK